MANCARARPQCPFSPAWHVPSCARHRSRCRACIVHVPSASSPRERGLRAAASQRHAAPLPTRTSGRRAAPRCRRAIARPPDAQRIARQRGTRGPRPRMRRGSAAAEPDDSAARAPAQHSRAEQRAASRRATRNAAAESRRSRAAAERCARANRACRRHQRAASSAHEITLPISSAMKTSLSNPRRTTMRPMPPSDDDRAGDERAARSCSVWQRPAKQRPEPAPRQAASSEMRA